MSTLEGTSVTGTWTLRVEDARSGRRGTLLNWSMVIEHGAGSSNTAPTANDQSPTLNEDAIAVPITLTGFDADGDNLSYVVVTGPAMAR